MKKIIMILILVCAVAGYFGYRYLMPAIYNSSESHSGCAGDDHEKADEDNNDSHNHSEGESCGGNDEEDGAIEIELSDAQIIETGIKIAVAAGGRIYSEIEVSGEVRVNSDRLAHISPNVSGRIISADATLGDKIKAGDCLAVIESRELADLKTEYLAARERFQIYKKTFEREENLFKEEIISQQDYLDKKATFVESQISLNSAQQKLFAIGFDEKYIDSLSYEKGNVLTKYEILAQFDATVITKHASLGEFVRNDSEMFIVADLSSVWVDFQAFAKDISSLRVGQKATIEVDSQSRPIESRVSYVSPIVDEKTRSVLVRVVLPNISGEIKPGLFVRAKISTGEENSDVVVPVASVVAVDGEKIVFVQDEHGFEPVMVETGSSDSNGVEILSGIKIGQKYVAQGAFELKSILVTSNLDPHAGHGH